ncbi:sugar transferase [Hujiaoplasma nucleasis]|uniref:Sugar transferase n=1 Tax=Hujiaoplasma nucleasis TaxID=2725268 RepID=A0A7L6N0Q2_9MOLU|nr:sugar transferase [Hujiaoplasma nucleasis]QLY39830.1 sugar transferase [Hujiaoplasma nucleasis]
MLSWEKLPNKMKNNHVKEYYEILRKRKHQIRLKRLFDIVFSVLLLILTLPVMIIIAIAIKTSSPGTVFFKQERITIYGNKFKIIKFRTMKMNSDLKQQLTTKMDNRVTKIGKFLRKFRIDELPQLINIIKGEMTFVGTRPEVEKYVKFYTPEMLSTLLLPAGVTSEASIYYRDEASQLDNLNEKEIDDAYIKNILPKKMEYNTKYLRNFSLGRDLIILFKTMSIFIDF